MGKRGNPNWKKGLSGNPTGLGRRDIEVRDLARQYTDRAIKRLAEIMEGENVKAAAFAANALLDRGFGRPSQALSVTGNMGISFSDLVGQAERERGLRPED